MTQYKYIDNRLVPEYKYHGFVFRPTTTMTEVNVLNRSRCYTTKLVPLYEIDGLKECGKHPLLTTIAECKEYIRICEEANGIGKKNT